MRAVVGSSSRLKVRFQARRNAGWPCFPEGRSLKIEPPKAPLGSAVQSTWFLERQLDVAGCAVVGDESTRNSLLKVFMIGPKFFVLLFFFIWTHLPSAVKVQSPNHWTTREFPED